jgi:Glycosyl transferase family 21
VNAKTTSTAAAAGGCMLVERHALERAGGVSAIRSALIDDCALARVMKVQGPIWLGLTDRVISMRSYPSSATSGAWSPVVRMPSCDTRRCSSQVRW